MLVNPFIDKVKISAGLVIIQDNKILLLHPTNSKWFGTYSIPKGHVEYEDENILETAIRETKEETGLNINTEDIESGPHLITYINKKEVYKKIYYFIVRPTKRIEKQDLILQQEEVNWGGFLTKSEAEKRIFHRLNKILDLL